MSESFKYRTSSEGIRYLDFSDFMNLPCGTLIKNNGFSKSDFTDLIKKIAGIKKKSKSKISEHIIELDQKHTNNVVESKLLTNGYADGVYSSSSNDILTIKSADCFPIFLYDGKTAGLIHAGWRGCVNGIIENFLKVAPEFNLTKAKAAIGPGIGSCCFKVSPEVALLFDKKYRLRNKGDFLVNLKEFIVDELSGFGIRYILDNDACTMCDEKRFHSFRREGKKFRQMISYINAQGG